MNMLKIVRLVEKELNVRVAMSSERKSSPAKTARYIAMMLMYEENHTHYRIGRYFKVHRSVITKTLIEADWLLRTDQAFKASYLICIAEITAIADREEIINYCAPRAFELIKYEREAEPAKFISPYNIDLIINATTQMFGVTVYKVKSKQRTKDISQARHMIVILSRRYNSNLSLSQIGDMLGRRDHSTIINSMKRGDDLLIEDRSFKEKYYKLVKHLNNYDTATFTRTS